MKNFTTHMDSGGCGFDRSRLAPFRHRHVESGDPLRLPRGPATHAAGLLRGEGRAQHLRNPGARVRECGRQAAQFRAFPVFRRRSESVGGGGTTQTALRLLRWSLLPDHLVASATARPSSSIPLAAKMANRASPRSPTSPSSAPAIDRLEASMPANEVQRRPPPARISNGVKSPFSPACFETPRVTPHEPLRSKPPFFEPPNHFFNNLRRAGPCGCPQCTFPSCGKSGRQRGPKGRER